MLAALELDRLEKAGKLIAIVDQIAPGPHPQFLNAQVARFRAHLAARAGKAAIFERLEAKPWLER
jgi:hypothetical protein